MLYARDFRTSEARIAQPLREIRATFPLLKPATIADSLPAPTVRVVLCMPTGTCCRSPEFPRSLSLSRKRVRPTPPQGARESKSVSDDDDLAPRHGAPGEAL